ncbi:MAG: hypothetical protein HQL90_11585, partial [Magnetococcales bacterium]|nr:hypothetical protein [Magnetococcales bacterium]
YEQAESLYRRAIESDPNDANTLGNFAGFLLGIGNPSGLEILKRVVALESTEEALQLELAFYCLAHWPEQWDAALRQTRLLIAKGVRSPGWDLTANCHQAALQQHPQVDFLRALAQVVADNATAETVQHFSCWQTD